MKERCFRIGKEGASKTMREYPCSYTVARFLPNPLREEARNLGVVLQCIGRGFIGAKFEPDLRKRIGVQADDVDVRVVRAYVEELEANIQAFQGQSLGLPGMVQPLHPDYLKHFWLTYTSKIQFSEPKGCVAEDPAEELNELFSLLVEEEPSARVKVEKRSSFAKEFGKQLREACLSGRNKVKANYPVVVKNQQIPVDFGYRHARRDREILIETVDLTSEFLTERIEALSVTAVKFEILKEVKRQAVKTVSVVKTLAKGDAHAYGLELRELNHHSDHVFDLSKPPAARDVISMIREDLGATAGHFFAS